MRIRQDQKSVKQSKRGWRLWHDETGATFGSPVDLLAALFLFWGLMVMGGVSVTLIKYQLALESSLQYAQAAAMDSNMIDPATNQPIDQELVQAFSQQLPVANQGEAIEGFRLIVGRVSGKNPIWRFTRRQAAGITPPFLVPVGRPGRDVFLGVFHIPRGTQFAL